MKKRMTGWELKEYCFKDSTRPKEEETTKVHLDEIDNDEEYDVKIIHQVSYPIRDFEWFEDTIEITPVEKSIMSKESFYENLSNKFRKKLAGWKRSTALRTSTFVIGRGVILISVILLTICLGQTFWNSLKDKNVDVPCTVLAKFLVSDVHRSYTEPRFLLVLKSDTGIKFDSYVTPSTFVDCSEGDHIVLKSISRYKVDPDYTNHSFFYMVFTLGGVIFTCILIGLFAETWPKHRKKMQKIKAIDNYFVRT